MPTKPPTFRPSHLPSRQQIAKDYDKARGTAHQRGYTSRLRTAMTRFKADNPLCLGCKAVGRVTPTAVTDHITPARGDTALLWDMDNWQPACREHHDIVKQHLERMFDRGTVSNEALRLDSAVAVRLTLDLLR